MSETAATEAARARRLARGASAVRAVAAGPAILAERTSGEAALLTAFRDAEWRYVTATA